MTSLTIKNASNVAAAAEVPGALKRNHVCQLRFYNDPRPRRAIFEASVNDGDGWADINNATLKWHGNDYVMTKLSGAGTGGTMRAVVDFDTGDNASLAYPLFVNVVDGVGSNSGFDDSGRDWKVWNCLVSVSGTLYDGSSGQVCNTTGFSTVADGSMNNTSPHKTEYTSKNISPHYHRFGFGRGLACPDAFTGRRDHASSVTASQPSPLTMHIADTVENIVKGWTFVTHPVKALGKSVPLQKKPIENCNIQKICNCFLNQRVTRKI